MTEIHGSAPQAAVRRRSARHVSTSPERSREPDSSAGCRAGVRPRCLLGGLLGAGDKGCYLLSVAQGSVGGSAPVQPPSSPLSSNLTLASRSANAAQSLWFRLCPPPGEEVNLRLYADKAASLRASHPRHARLRSLPAAMCLHAPTPHQTFYSVLFCR